MSDEVIERIKQRGYWRVNFRPLTREEERPGVPAAKRLVEACTVSLRGWDFPHMPGDRIDDGDRKQILGSSFQAFTEWADKREFWSIFTSGQFIHLKGIRSDWQDQDTIRSDPQRFPPNVLGLVDNIWHVTEAFEFLFRLTEAELYRHGASVSISLHKTKGRTLYTDDVKRADFVYPRTTSADEIHHRVTLSPAAITDPKARTKDALRKLFAPFNYEPTNEVMSSIIDELYGLNIGRG